MASLEITVSKLHGLSIPARTLGTAIANIGHYTKGWEFSSRQTLHNCILASAMQHLDDFAGPQCNNAADILCKLRAELSTEEGFQEHINKTIKYEHGYFGDPLFQPIICLMHGVYTQGNWRLLPDEDFWTISQCYGCHKESHTHTTALKIMINAQTHTMTELMLNGFGDLNRFRLDVATIHYDHDGNLLLPLYTKRLNLRNIFEDEVHEHVMILN